MTPTPRWAVVLLTLGLCSVPAYGQPAADAPFYLRTQNPFLATFGVPAPQGGRLTAAGRLDGRLAASIANHADSSANDTESVTFDGESYYVDALIRYGLTERWEIGLDVPYVAHRNGHLDGFIENWHDLWGLTNASRQGPDNQLRIAYADGGAEAFQMTDGSGGLGDLRLTAAYALRSGGRALALRGQVELPTGDTDHLRGSGGTDVALGLEITDPVSLARWSMTWFGQAGVMYAGEGEVLQTRQRDVVPFGSAGIAWHWTEALSLQAQFALQGEQFDSDLYPLGGSVMSLSVGGAYHWRQLGLELDVALVEDLVSDPTPDFGLYVSLTRRTGAGS